MTELVKLSVAVSLALGGSSCAVAPAKDKNIRLYGFSERNYTALDSKVGQNICITGKIMNDTAGVYFALQPIEADGIITVGFSRINVVFDRDRPSKEQPVSGRIYTACGNLTEATPFDRCQTDLCKWYRLERATFR